MPQSVGSKGDSFFPAVYIAWATGTSKEEGKGESRNRENRVPLAGSNARDFSFTQLSVSLS